MTSAVAARAVHVEHCMGTVFTIDLRDPGDWAAAAAECTAWLHRVDRIFSTYRADSDISRINAGELRVADADPLVGEMLGLCADLQDETGGFFSARRDGRIDPTGVAKGWAIERASELLCRAGSTNHAVNGGGDLQVVGEQAPGEPWRIGIADPTPGDEPAAAQTVRCVVAIRDGAVATSGVAERGAHIIDPFTGGPAGGGLLSVSVAGPQLTRADAYATAAFVMGPAGLDWIAAQPSYDAMLIDADGNPRTTPGWPAANR